MADLVLDSSVEIAKLSAGLARIDKQLGGLTKTSKENEKQNKRTGDSLDRIGKAGKAAGQFLAAAGMLGGVIALTAGLVTLDNQLDATEASLNQLTSGDAVAFTEAIQEGTEGTVSALEAQGVALQAVGLGLAETEEEAAEFARTAAILGGTFRGLGAAQAAEEFSLLLSNMSVQRLDTFGISSAKVRAEIKALQGEVPGLSRELAFNQVVMAEATARAEELSGALSTNAAEFQRLSANVQDFIGKAAEPLGDFFASGARGANILIASFERLETVNQEASARFFSTGGSVEELADAFENLSLAQSQLLITERELFVQQAQGLSAAEARQFVALERSRDTEQFIANLQAQLHAEQALSDQHRVDIALLGNLVRTNDQLAESTEDATDAIVTHEDALKKMEERRKEVTKAQEDAIRSSEQLFGAQQNLAGIAAGLTDALSNLGLQGFQEGGGAAEAYISVLQATGAEAALAGDAYRELALESGLLTEEQLKLADGGALIGEAIKAGIIDAGEGFDLFNELIDGSLSTVGELGQEIESMSGRVGDGFDNIRDAVGEGLFPQDDLEALGDIDLTPVEEGVAGVNALLNEQKDALAGITENAPLAFNEIQLNSPFAVEALTPLTEKLTTASQMLNNMRDGAEETFGNLALFSAAAAAEGGGLALAATLLAGMHEAWAFFKDNPLLNIKLLLEVASVGGLPVGGEAAGGGSFMTTKPTLLLVGENPGHREKVDVTPLSGRGRTRVRPGSGLIRMAGGGSVTTGGGGGGGMSLSIGQITVVSNSANPKQVAREITPALLREFRLLGINLNAS